MIPLDMRLDKIIKEMEIKYKLTLSDSKKEELKEGISVGYSKENTFDSAEKIVENRVISLLNSLKKVV